MRAPAPIGRDDPVVPGGDEALDGPAPVELALGALSDSVAGGKIRSRSGRHRQPTYPLRSWAWRRRSSPGIGRGRDLRGAGRADLYAVLVSEVMLQQTQVERVLRLRGLASALADGRESLAAAPLADIIRAWQGLGYNRRAVNLPCAAAHVAAHGWPEDLTELPGVGATRPTPSPALPWRRVLPVDTNVRRVLERTGGSFGADSTDALMDLGATVCIARIPRCEECPPSAAVLHAAGATSPQETGPLRRIVPPAPRRDPAPRRRASAL